MFRKLHISFLSLSLSLVATAVSVIVVVVGRDHFQMMNTLELHRGQQYVLHASISLVSTTLSFSRLISFSLSPPFNLIEYLSLPLTLIH